MRKPRLKTRITLAVTLLVAAIMGVLALLADRYLQARVQGLVADQLNTLATVVASELERNISSASQAVSRLAEDVPAPLLRNPEAAARFLRGRYGFYPQFDDGLVLLDPEGRVVAETPYDTGRTGTVFTRPDLSGTGFDQRRPAISDPFFTPRTGDRAVVLFTAPIAGADGKAAGVLGGGVEIDADTFLAPLTNIRIGRHGRLWIVGSATSLVFSEGHAAQPVQGVPQELRPLVQRAASEGSASGEIGKGGGVAAAVRLKRTGWTLVALYPSDEAYAAAGRQAHLATLAVFPALLVLCVLAVRLVIEWVTAPLERFTRHVQAVSREGLHTLPFRVEGVEEIETMAAAFDHLVEELAGQREKLQEQLEFLQTLIDAIPSPVFYKGIDGRYLGFNCAFSAFIGMSKEEGVGKTVFDCFPPDLARIYDKADAELFAKGGVQVYEGPVRPAAGGAREVVFYKATFAAADGSTAGLI
ncbi:MAG TPA: cache domain-containing protein, partial [Verrucomicrobiae bacterium]|nr:cache domain-containing protein [Verrucomicrobiae bacterium]